MSGLNREGMLAVIADAIVANYPGYAHVYCGHCWKEGRVTRGRGDMGTREGRIECAERFYEDQGWRASDVPACRACARRLGLAIQDIVGQ